MTAATHCLATRADGECCEVTFSLSPDGLCPAHVPGARERLAAQAALGGAARAAKYAGDAFEPDEVDGIGSIDDAKRQYDVVRRAVLTRRITHAEGNAATKAIDGWCKAETAGLTRNLVNEIHAELDAKTKLIDELAEENRTLRKQLAGLARTETAS